ncbi:hypothetical protein ACFL30_02595 [Candidatus Latescibacterota bacterium]
MNNEVTGLMIVGFAAFLQGSSIVPLYYTRTWKWEHHLMMFSLFGLIVFTMLFALITVPGLSLIYRASWPGDMIAPLVAGVICSIGILVFRYGVSAAGFTSGYAAIFGVSIGMGTVFPLVFLHSDTILSVRGIIVLSILFVVLTFSGIVGIAGMRKKCESGKTTDRTGGVSSLSVKTGVILCLFSGLCLSFINIGFVMSRPLTVSALSFGASDYFSGIVVWSVLFISGGVLIFLYSIIIMGVNKSAHNFAAKGAFINFFLLLAMSCMWILSYVFYSMGSAILGAWGTTAGWLVFMTLSSIFIIAWRFFLKPM